MVMWRIVQCMLKRSKMSATRTDDAGSSSSERRSRAGVSGTEDEPEETVSLDGEGERAGPVMTEDVSGSSDERGEGVSCCSVLLRERMGLFAGTGCETGLGAP